MEDFSLAAAITGDSSGFQEAISQASEALGSFMETAAGVSAGIGGAELFGAITGGLGELSNYIVGTTSDFQSYGATIGNSLDNIANSAGSTSDAVSAGAAKQAASALEAADAFQTYQEKVQEINDNIAEVMQGSNITDAIDSYQQKLEDAQQQYADKVASINQQIEDATDQMNTTIANKQQSAQDTLADMQSSHAVQVADTQEKQQQELQDATSATARAALLEKFAQENQLAEDSYQRQYQLKQQEEARSVAEATQAAQDQANKKITTYQAELAKEAEAEQDKETKLKAQEDAEISRLQAENAKKLEMYQRELADEERSYQLSLAKRAASSTGGGGGLGSRSEFGFGPLGQTEKGQQFFTDINESVEKLQGNLVQLASTQPFRLHDIEDAAQGMTALGLNVESTEPIVADLAGKFHTTLGTAMQALQDEMAGNGRMMMTTFHISKDQIQGAYDAISHTNEPIKNVNQLMMAMEALDTKQGDLTKRGIEGNKQLSGSFAGDASVLMNTLPGITSNVQDQFDKVALAFMGLNTNADHFGEIEKGGLFDMMRSHLQDLAKWLTTNQKEIATVAEAAGRDLVTAFKILGDGIKIVIDIVKGIIDIFSFFRQHSTLTAGVLGGLATVIGTALIPVIYTFATVTIPAAVAGIGAVTSAALLWIALFAAVAVVIIGVIEAIQHWNDIMATLQKVIGTVTNWIKKNFADILLWLGPAGLLVAGIVAVADQWKTILRTVQDMVKVFVDLVTGNWKELLPDIQKVMTDIGNFLAGMAKDFYNWGTNLATQFIKGITDLLKNVGSILTGPIQAAFASFKGHSPPTEGPLKDIDTWGFNVGMAWVKGFQGALANVGLGGASSALGSMGAGGLGMESLGAVGNYNTTNASQSITSNSVVLNNSFNVPSQTTAGMVTNYLGFMLEQKGIV